MMQAQHLAHPLSSLRFKQLDTDQSMTVSILEFEEMFDDPGTQAGDMGFSVQSIARKCLWPSAWKPAQQPLVTLEPRKPASFQCGSRDFLPRALSLTGTSEV